MCSHVVFHCEIVLINYLRFEANRDNQWYIIERGNDSVRLWSKHIFGTFFNLHEQKHISYLYCYFNFLFLTASLISSDKSVVFVARCSLSRAGVEPDCNWILLLGDGACLKEVITGCDLTKSFFCEGSQILRITQKIKKLSFESPS